ncbi:hypothetical protein [Oceanobacillus halotolerans]|uniref:hypothetical protein n=1 Tax=Oceanobacillus halotolerans TaxID=2663380 RepID=UPI0013D97E6F|nr:hypothetical protein [Oceanobacillus halotolerans]
MDWIVLTVFFSILAICAILIIITLVSLPQLGDERKNYIKMKAQSYSFAVVIFWMLIEIVENFYVTTWTDGSYGGVNPFTFLIVLSVVYLITLLFFKRKYGG